MPGVGREPLRKVIKEKIEAHGSAGFSVADLRAEAKTAFGEYGEAEFFTGAAFEAALGTIVVRATAEGLTKEELQLVFKEVRRHVSIQSHFDASRAHEKKRADTGKLNLFGHWALNFKDATTRFGGGLAKDVRTKERQFFAGSTEVQAMIEAAVELGIMRHRLERYAKLDEEPTPAVPGVPAPRHQPHLRELSAEYKGGLVRSNELLNKETHKGAFYDQALDHIVDKINLTVGEDFVLDGQPPIHIENEHVVAAIKHHLKFVMRTEIIQLMEAEQLLVLSSDEYNVTHKTGWQKAVEFGKGVITSGTFWGVVTRVGGRVAVGGVLGLGAAAVASGPALWLGVGAAAAIGAGAGMVRERINAQDRIKRRRLEAALGGIDDTVVKRASVINKELVDSVILLRNAKTAELAATDPNKAAAKVAAQVAVEQLYKVIADAQARLLKARIGEIGAEGDKEHPKQDYISFGTDNRFVAQKQLLANIEKSLAEVQLVLEVLPDAQRVEMQRKFSAINIQQNDALKIAEKNLGEKLTANEDKLQTRAAVIGAIAGGLGSFFSHTFAEAIGNKVADVIAPVIPGGSAVENTVEQVVTVPGAEPITAAGKMAFVTHDGADYMIGLQAGQIEVHKILPDGVGTPGNDIQFSRTITLPDFQDDTLQAVETADGVQLLDAAGKPLGELHFSDVTGSGVGAAGNITEQLFADPEASKLLDAMGLQPGEVQYDPNTHLFHIPDNALRDAAGHPEYLGQTAGWRARRMEFILKALAEGKTGESSDMIVARAERATANLLLKSASHGDPKAAFDEAFGKDASFIQKNIMPWIDGTRSRVSGRWMKLVTELKTQPLATTLGDGSAGVGGSEVTFTTGAPGAETLTTTEGVAGDAAATAAEPVVPYVFNDAVELKAAGVGVAVAGVAETVLHAWPKPNEAVRDAVDHDESSSADEFNVQDTTKLQDIGDVVTKAETAEAARVAAEAAAAATRLAGEKGPAIKAEINAFITDANTATKSTSDALLAVRTAMGTALDGTHIDQLIANAAGIDALRTKLAEAEALLAKDEAGLQYQAIDAANGGRLAAWITSQTEALKTGDELKVKFEAIVAGVATKITETRKITDAAGTDKGIPAATRRSELTTELAKLALPSRVGELVPSVMSDGGSLVADIAKTKQEAELAIVVIDLNDLIGKNGDLRKAVNERLTAEGCFDPSDLSLPVPTKAIVVTRLLEQMKVKSNGKTGAAALREMKLLNSSMDPFDTDEQTELKRVLDRLFSGESDIFSK